MEILKKDEFSEQLDHIAYMFNVRTKGKKYENFIVNAIYTKVGNPDLIPVTQQYVQSTKDSRRYYLLDLYFPQINFGVEIDEGQHFSKEHTINDKKREEDIKSAINCEAERIPIVNKSTGKNRTYLEICEDIDRIVEIIKQKIVKKGGVKWETNEDRKRSLGLVKNGKGKFDIKQDVTYRRITDIYNICGGCRGTGEDATKLQRCYYKLNDSYYLWVPKLTIDIGSTLNSPYTNTLSEDRKIIKEKKNDVEQIDAPNPNFQRVAFMRMKDIFGRPCIKFIGVFKFSHVDGKECVYERVAASIKISELKQ